jgi:hypothetical protein
VSEFCYSIKKVRTLLITICKNDKMRRSKKKRVWTWYDFKKTLISLLLGADMPEQKMQHRGKLSSTHVVAAG